VGEVKVVFFAGFTGVAEEGAEVTFATVISTVVISAAGATRVQATDTDGLTGASAWRTVDVFTTGEARRTGTFLLHVTVWLVILHAAIWQLLE
jgi:hypothetical protein